MNGHTIMDSNSHTLFQYNNIKSQTSRQPLVEDLKLLIGTQNLSFLYVYDPFTFSLTRTILRGCLQEATCGSDRPNSHLLHCFVDAVTCLSPKMLYTTVLNAFAGFRPAWDEVSLVWNPDSGLNGGMENLDIFLHGLADIATKVNSAQDHVSNGDIQSEDGQVASTKFVLVVENADRLIENLSFLLTPLSRLGELVGSLYRG